MAHQRTTRGESSEAGELSPVKEAPTLAVQHPPEDDDNADNNKENNSAAKHKHSTQPTNAASDSYDESDELTYDIPYQPPTDPLSIAQQHLIATSHPTTDLEVALKAELERNTAHIARLREECIKLRGFINRRKQPYKRKRMEREAPRKSLSAYNLFVREQFVRLAKENESVLQDSADMQLARVVPQMNVAAAGKAWKKLTQAEKAKYEALAKPDKVRYEAEVAAYCPGERRRGKKRQKTGYNLFYTDHVAERKRGAENDNSAGIGSGIQNERGATARIVGEAWKKLSPEERDEYERKAVKMNRAKEREEEEQGEKHQHGAGEMEPAPIMVIQPSFPPPLMAHPMPPPQHMQQPMPPPPQPTQQQQQQQDQQQDQRGPPLMVDTMHQPPSQPHDYGREEHYPTGVYPPVIHHPHNGVYFPPYYPPGPYDYYPPPSTRNNNGQGASLAPPPEMYYPPPDYRGPPPPAYTNM
jgi:hypothetical protein